MRKQSLALVVILALSISIFLAGFVVAPNIYASYAYNSCQTASGTFAIISTMWGTPTSQVQAGPNEQNVPLIVTADYNGACTATAILATLGPLPTGFTDSNGNPTASSFISNIPPGMVFQMTYYLNLDSNASVGTYSIPVEYSWNNTSTNSLTLNTAISVSLKGSVALSFEVTNTYLSPGQTNHVTVVVNNTGSGDATQIQITPTVSSTFASVLNQISPISILSSSTTARFDLSLFVSSNAAGSPISIALASVYTDPYGNTRTYSQTLGFNVGTIPQASLSVSSNQQSLGAGQANNLALTLTNTGNVAMNYAILSISAPPSLALIGSDGTFNLGNLGAGTSSTVQVDVFVSSISTSPVTLTVTVSFNDQSGNAHVQTRSLSFFLNQNLTSSPIAVTATPTTLTAGLVNNISLTLSNTGYNPLNSISASFAFPTSALVTWLNPTNYQKSVLQPGQNVTLNGQAYLSPNAPTSSLLQITFNYYDSSGNQHQEMTSVGLLSRGDIDIVVTSIIVTPQIVTPGQVFSVTLTLTNIGTSTATAVSAVTGAPGVFKIFGSNSVFVGDMATSTPTPLTLTFIVQDTTTPGTYNVPVQLSYFDNLRNNDSQLVNIPIAVASGSVTSTAGTTTTPTRPELGLLAISIIVIVALVMLAVGYFVGRRHAKR